MTRRDFVRTMVATTLSAGFGIDAMAKQAGKKPNIVWIFSDDHSYQTIGAYGGRLKDLDMTPNIDKLAEQGMLFQRCYVENSICAPSRATLLTGKFSHKHGKYTNTGGFDQGQQTFPKVLRKNGYQTAMIGKIHLPGRMQGFDYWEVLPGQGIYFNPRFITEDGDTRYQGYTTDIITDRALNWMKNERDPDKPFMVMIHHKAPHRNWEPAPRHMEKYADIEIPEPDNLFDDYETRGIAAREQDMSISTTMRMDSDLKVRPNDPKALEGQYAARNKYYLEHKDELTGDALTRWKYQLYMKDFLRCIWGIDENVGRVLDHLEENGLAENTVVMYSSDQGFFMGEHGWFDKRFMYEESFRTPLIARWPGVVEPGSQSDALVQNIDFAGTFLDIAGAPIPDDMQGESILPLLKGETPNDWRKSLYYHYYEYPFWHMVRKHEGVANERYKLIRFYGKDVPNGEEWEFYDLKKDPSEMKNVYSHPDHAEKIAAMKVELARLREKYEVPDDDPNVPVLQWDRRS